MHKTENDEVINVPNPVRKQQTPEQGDSRSGQTSVCQLCRIQK